VEGARSARKGNLHNPMISIGGKPKCGYSGSEKDDNLYPHCRSHMGDSRIGRYNSNRSKKEGVEGGVGETQKHTIPFFHSGFKGWIILFLPYPDDSYPFFSEEVRKTMKTIYPPLFCPPAGKRGKNNKVFFWCSGGRRWEFRTLYPGRSGGRKGGKNRSVPFHKMGNRKEDLPVNHKVPAKVVPGNHYPGSREKKAEKNAPQMVMKIYKKVRI